jgi:hypothetical protein
LGSGLCFSFVIFFYTDGRTPWRVISPSQDRYIHTGQHKHRINSHTDIHAFSRIRTHDGNVQPSEDSSCLRPRGYCDWLQTCFIVADISKVCLPKLRSRDSAVGTATGYGLDDRGVGVRAPVESRIFSCPRRSDQLCGPPNLLSNVYWGLFLRG